MNDQCKFCVHENVCKYKEHYEDAVKLNEKAKEGANYPFLAQIDCIQFISSTQSTWEVRESMRKQTINDQCKFCVIEDVCPYKEHYKDELKLYEKVREKCEKYPVLTFETRCTLFTTPKRWRVRGEE